MNSEVREKRVLINYQRLAQSFVRSLARSHHAARRLQHFVRHTKYGVKIQQIHACKWLLITDLLANMPEAQQETCTLFNRDYCKLCQWFPADDQRVWEPNFPIIFAAFLDLYRSNAKMIVGKQLSPRVLFHFQLLRMIRMKLLHLALLIQEFKNADQEVDVLNCISITCLAVRDAHVRVAETMPKNMVAVSTIQRVFRRLVVRARLDPTKYCHHYPEYDAGLKKNYDEARAFTDGAMKVLSKFKDDEKSRNIFATLVNFSDVLVKKSEELLEKEGWCHPVCRLVRESDRVSCFCEKYSKKQEEARRLKQKQRERQERERQKEIERIALQTEQERAIAAAKALASLEEEKKMAEQAEQQRLTKQRELAEKEALRKKEAEEEKAAKVRAAAEKAALKKQQEKEEMAAFQALMEKKKEKKAAGGKK